MSPLLLTSAFAAPILGSAAIPGSDRDPIAAMPGFDDPDHPVPYIINGEPATRDDWPMTGGVLLTGEGRYSGASIGSQATTICTSTLIAPDVVLLAAHCVDPAPLDEQLALVGLELEDRVFYWTRKADLSAYQLGLPAGDYPADAVAAVGSVFHPDWDYRQIQLGLAENHDIALLFLSEPVLDVPLGYLPQAETAEVELEVDEEVVVVGWGQQFQSQPGQQADPNAVGTKRMGVSHVERRREYEFQVGGAPLDVRKCHGDSGGPSFKEVPTDSSDVWRVVGVTSHTYDATDCVVTGGVDTRVSYYLDWIDAEMRAACADGTRVWCEVEGVIPPPLPDGTVAWAIPDEEDAKKGCGCQSTPAPAAFVALLPLLALVRRRR